jgi:hypothetical protein
MDDDPAGDPLEHVGITGMFDLEREKESFKCVCRDRVR